MALQNSIEPPDGKVKTDNVRSFDVTPSFSIQAVDGLRGDKSDEHNRHRDNTQVVVTPIRPPKPREPKLITFHPDPDPSLGQVMDKFVGTFVGSGMNTIFLPTSGFGSDSTKGNLLQINLTVERLQFMQGSILGKVPNRGFEPQANVRLTGIPYQQTVSDRLNVKSGKADLETPVSIHFEQGLFLLTPATESPKNPATISRLASIPHGTAFTAQDIEPQSMIEGPPVIPDTNIMPFPVTGTAIIGKVNGGQPNMVDEVVDKAIREPHDLGPFIRTGVLTKEIIGNPNQVLQAVNAKKEFVGHWTFSVRTKHPAIGGGGVSNIAFLADGDKTSVFSDAVNGNANATDVTCQYWVSIVKHKVDIPAGDYTNTNAKVLPNDNLTNFPGPKFEIQVGKKLNEKKTIDLTSTQIQYSQNVRLDFGILAWPHVSVATLAPDLPIFIPSDHSALAGL